MIACPYVRSHSWLRGCGPAPGVLPVGRLERVEDERPHIGRGEPLGFLPLAQPAAPRCPGLDRGADVGGEADRADPGGDHRDPDRQGRVHAVGQGTVPQPGRHHLQQREQRGTRHRHGPAGQVREDRQFGPQPDRRVLVECALGDAHVPQRAGLAQSAPQVMLRGRTTPAGVAVAASRRPPQPPRGRCRRASGSAAGSPCRRRTPRPRPG